WIMVVAKSKLLKLSFFRSDDLINWKFLSDYEMPGITEIYECPDLINVDENWVLFLSTNPGGPAGGSGMHYVIGKFDGQMFVGNTKPKPLDYGPDYYAAVTFSNSDEKISLGWMNNWDYANSRDLSNQSWNGAMTSARKLTIEYGDLMQSFLAPTHTFKVSTSSNFQFKYETGAVKFKHHNGFIQVDRSELWSQSLTQFNIPIPTSNLGKISIVAIFDAGSLELSLDGCFITLLLEVGPELPPLEIL
ncbi:MAG: hypothetical protein ACKOQL_02125, partial [Actinomycetes bacterium]